VLGMLVVGTVTAWYRTKGQARTARAGRSVSPSLLPVIAQPDTG
jgi:hypothetical protein